MFSSKRETDLSLEGNFKQSMTLLTMEISMKIICLGTSGAIPTKARNLPATALKMNDGSIILFDAGEDVQRQFLKANLKFNAPTIILISHMHGDHLIGLPGLLFTFHLNNRSEKLTIIGPEGIFAYLKFQASLIGLSAKEYPLTIVEIPFAKDWEKKPEKECELKGHLYVYEECLRGETEISRKSIPIREALIASRKTYRIKAYRVLHSIPTFAFRVEEQPRAGKFDPLMAKKCNVPQGPLWGKMQEGKSVKLKDGTIIDPVEQGIVGPKRPGAIIVYSGDTKIFKNLIKIVQEADYFICESTYGDDHEELAKEKRHLTARHAAKVANEANARHLILTHYSNRYKDPSELERQAREVFENSYSAKDLQEFKVVRRE